MNQQIRFSFLVVFYALIMGYVLICDCKYVCVMRIGCSYICFEHLAAKYILLGVDHGHLYGLCALNFF